MPKFISDDGGKIDVYELGTCKLEEASTEAEGKTNEAVACSEAETSAESDGRASEFQDELSEFT